MQLLDGKKLANEIKEELKVAVSEKIARGERPPHLAAILVGSDGASKTYVGHKIKLCEYVGFQSSLIELSEDVTEEAVLQKVEELNKDETIDGFIVQLPLPDHIDASKITLAINPKKDVDGFHPVNMGRMTQGLPAFLPATPFGIVQLLERNKIETSGKHCVVLGRSNIVGTPMSILLSRKSPTGNATVTLCHSRTKNLAEVTRQADILVVAIGKPNFITEDMVKDNAVVIDVGIHRIQDSSKKRGYRLVGDVDFEKVAPKCSHITPVPGGVGPLTVVSLMKNTLLATEHSH